MPGIYSLLEQLIEATEPAALATAISGRLLGSKLLVSGGRPWSGSIHPELDAAIAGDAWELLAAEKNEARPYLLGEEQVEVFIETFPPPQRLIIVGAVHIAIPLHRLAKMLGYSVTVVDPRGVLATVERFPQADSIVTEWPDDALGALKPDSGTSVVVLTHDPKFDHPALLTALHSQARYIGAIGSRTTNRRRMAALREVGVEEEGIARVYAPVGLDIGAKTPAEIALSIMAEIVAARHNRSGGNLRDDEGRRAKDESVKRET